MRIAVTGSIATDYLMRFPGRFADQLVADQLDRVSLSFLVDDLQLRRGGVAANIAFGMAVLGERPLLVGSVGADFEEYRNWLERHGVDCDHVRVSEALHTARFLCTTDEDSCQIASFYAGAMTEARFIELGPIVRSGVDLVVVAPNDPEAMRRHTEECRQVDVPFVADPSQQLARINAADIRILLDGARYLICNDYELGMIAKKSGWAVADVVARVGTAVVTFGPKGSVLYRSGEPDLAVPALPEQAIIDPTGVGDAFRAGFLCGHAWGASDERAAQLGSALATVALEVVGTQEYRITLPALLLRIEDAYGADVAFELEALAAASAAALPDS